MSLFRKSRPLAGRETVSGSNLVSRYTLESAAFDGTTIVITKEDDDFKYDTECTRFFALMNLATNNDLHYLLISPINDKKAVE